jgi:hypothetical protein
MKHESYTTLADYVTVKLCKISNLLNHMIDGANQLLANSSIKRSQVAGSGKIVSCIPIACMWFCLPMCLIFKITFRALTKFAIS